MAAKRDFSSSIAKSMNGIFAVALVIVIAIAFGGRFGVQSEPTPEPSQQSDAKLQQASASHESDVLVQGEGEVVRVLTDDIVGSRHQRFILKTSIGQTVLIAHNIDLAERIPNLEVGDRVEFKGEYEWNDQGGVIHWTHHDPQGRHEAGWLKHDGETYQ